MKALRFLVALLMLASATSAYTLPPRCSDQPECFCYDAAYTGGDSCCGCGNNCYVVQC